MKSGYIVKDDPNNSTGTLKTISKIKASGGGSPLEGFAIRILNADGEEVESWELQNPFIKSAKFGDLAYDNDELRTIELTVRYDWATCETDQGGIQFKEV